MKNRRRLPGKPLSPEKAREIEIEQLVQKQETLYARIDIIAGQLHSFSLVVRRPPDDQNIFRGQAALIGEYGGLAKLIKELRTIEKMLGDAAKPVQHKQEALVSQLAQPPAAKHK